MLSTKTAPLSKERYLNDIEEVVKNNYNSSNFPNVSFPREDWKILSEKGIMLSMIPKEFGGRDSHEELCEIIERISMHNLPLGMYTMIITALFVRNISKYGTDELKQEVLPKFRSEALIGGFALTEPHCGSNLAKMTTTFEKIDNGYILKGEKHWQAFSLTADWWLIAAKNIVNEKEFAYFVIQRKEGWETKEEYNALGLKAIDYGRSTINAVIPEYRRLNVTSKKLIGAIDFLCASRLSMAAMASGSISKIYEETKNHSLKRKIGNGKLYDIGYVKYKLKLILANKTTSKALYTYLKTKSDFRNNLLDNFFEAQAIKVLATDKMLESALNYQQLCGGEGYRYNSPNNNSAYALLNSRVYTIFDGTNDLLSQQITEYCIKEAKEETVLDFLKRFNKTKQAFDLIDIDLSILNNNKTQEEKVMNGQIISRIFGLNCLVEATKMGDEKPFEYGDFRNAVLFLTADIKKTLTELEILENNCLSCM